MSWTLGVEGSESLVQNRVGVLKGMHCGLGSEKKTSVASGYDSVRFEGADAGSEVVVSDGAFPVTTALRKRSRGSLAAMAERN